MTLLHHAPDKVLSFGGHGPRVGFTVRSMPASVHPGVAPQPPQPKDHLADHQGGGHGPVIPGVALIGRVVALDPDVAVGYDDELRSRRETTMPVRRLWGSHHDVPR